MQLAALARAVPIAVGVVVLIAGALQGGTGARPYVAGTACASASTAATGLTAILLVIGVMDVRAMAVVTAASPSNVSHRPVSTSREQSEPSSSGQSCS
jgi:hypothetical protein